MDGVGPFAPEFRHRNLVLTRQETVGVRVWCLDTEVSKVGTILASFGTKCPTLNPHLEHQMATQITCIRPNVDDLVGGQHHLFLMLNDDNRIAHVPQSL